ncbi:pentapeptide repeat-containing protein [Gymnodinialimonas ceratoperidinii]|uniref:Pentapeptide repeat-containing protein n=1 Tax=Gymnodinialimonas ceratoperidinii TaxID=2856823 RepID=A0A8F6TT77_9RHOB|nr:pentapeptide repeat-containing protein [Gymnodinialimonas ceratoperidinii]QXT38250.1 pentapeptide repeat-containing protein [Gymnodinialimonas ceratoperidinii]
MTVDELIADLQRPWHHGEHVDARGLVLDEPLVLDGMEVRGFDLSGAQLNGGLSARGTRFRGLAWLRKATIKGTCDLREASFRTDLRADQLEAEDVLLDDCELQGVLSLAGATLRSLSLRNALMMANVTLEGARIDGEVVLDGAEIMGGLWSAEAGIGALDHGEADIFGRLRLPG